MTQYDPVVEESRDEELRALMVRYQAGDEEAFRELYMRTAPMLRSYLMRWTDPAKAQDLTQETFLQIHRARRTFQSDRPVLPWMFAITRNVGLQYVRRTGRRISEDQNDDALSRAVVPSIERSAEARHALEKAIQSLTSEQREIVWLSDVQGLRSAEVARVVGASEGAVRVRLHRVHEKLRTLLSDLNQDEA